MSQRPQQNESAKTVDIKKIHSTEMTLESRSQQNSEMHHHHIQVSHEFLGGHFDIKG